VAKPSCIPLSTATGRARGCLRLWLHGPTSYVTPSIQKPEEKTVGITVLKLYNLTISLTSVNIEAYLYVKDASSFIHPEYVELYRK
jgi:hypothetical protein